MSNTADIAQRIISTALAKLSTASSGQHTYLSHLKVLEEAPERNGGGQKHRYLVLAESDTGDALIHKAKENSDGTFSIGKTWPLSFLRRVEVIEPNDVSLTLRRTYRWQAQDARERDTFVVALIRLFRLANPGAPLHVVGMQDLDTLAPELSAPPPYEHIPHAIPRTARVATSTKPEHADHREQQTLPLPVTTRAPRARRRRQLRAFLAGMLACLVLLQLPYLLLPSSAPGDAGPLVPHGVVTPSPGARTSATVMQYVPEGYHGGVAPPRSLGVLG